jgi:hypothetical protein
MTAIAHRLDRKLHTLPPNRAASVEKLVADVLDFVDVSPQSDAERAEAIEAHRAHWRRMDAMLEELDWSDFERPDQGVEETREDF